MKPRGLRDAGYTLVELMVAMALFAMVSTGMIMTLAMFGRAQRTAAALDLAQSGARASLELIGHDLEMAAAGAKSGIVTMAVGGQPQLLAVRVTDSAALPDRLDLILVDGSAAATLTAPYSNGQTALIVDSTGRFVNIDPASFYVQVSDLTRAVLVPALGVAAQTINITANVNNLPVAAYPPGSYVFRAREVTYFIDLNGPFGAINPLLMLDPDGPNNPLPGEPLAEGIEDFQVALGFDNNNDGLITNIGAAANDDEWIFNAPGEVAPLNLTNLRAARITLVARTVQPTAGIFGRRPAIENRAAGPLVLPDITFPRRVLRTEVTVRNFNL